MAQPQLPRNLSPAQGSPSPVSPYVQAAKRPRLPSVPPPSQPDSPYATSTFAMSPGAPTPPPTTASPAAPQTAAHSAPGGGLSLPQAQHHHNPHQHPTTHAAFAAPATPVISVPAMSLPTPAPTTPLSFTSATMAPIVPTPALATPTTTSYPPAPGIMGPPLKPPERPAKELEYDVTDSLAGTGIDLRAEEQYMSNLYSFDEVRTGFPQHAPGWQASSSSSAANQPAQPVGDDDASQARAEALAAQRAWDDSAARLAASRASELNNPFLNVAHVHAKAERIAKEYGLELNMDTKAANPIGRMKAVNDFSQPTIKITTKVGPDVAVIHTYGSWLPHDAYLADQIALLSLASKQRLRTLVSDAHIIARNRQLTSHGEVPEEWQIAAAPLKRADETTTTDGAEERSRHTGTKSLKRPAKTTPHGSEPPAKVAKISTPSLATMLRDLAREEREQEEARLRRRAARKAAATAGEAGAAQSRAGSVAPTTPAPDVDKSDKPMTKKELKRTKSLQTSEAASHASQNLTSKMFTGFSGAGGLFGKKSKGKTYDWMNSAGAGAGGGSFGAKSAGAAGAAGTNAPGSPAPASNALTAEGRNRMGAWREDREKGKSIQMRDWVYALEQDGGEPNMLQLCYAKLD